MVRFQWRHQFLTFSLLLCYTLMVLSSLPCSKAWTRMHHHHDSRERPRPRHSLSSCRTTGGLKPLPVRRRFDALQPVHALMRDNERVEEISHPSVRDSIRRKTIQSTLRQLLLLTALSGTAVPVLGTGVANAEQPQQPTTAADPFANFGEHLLEDFNNRDAVKQQRWPYDAASPLPPNTDDGQQQQIYQPPQTGTDMERALQKVKEQKRIDPRTHG